MRRRILLDDDPTDITILDAALSQAVWRDWFRDPTTWAPWLSFLRVLFGLPLGTADFALFRQCTGRTTSPMKGFTEAWLVVGRRGGKSMILALIACYLAIFRDWRPYLAPGEVGTIKIIATDRRQSRVIHRYCRALLTEVPALAPLVERDTEDELVLTNGIVIEVQTASFRAVRGYTMIACLCDEIAFYRTDDSANPDTEILAAIRPAMATVPNAMLLAASSPYARRGELWSHFRRYFGQDDAPALVWRADTRTMNPTVPQSVIDEATERDPASAAAEYGAEFRTDLESFVDREVVETLIAPGRFELPPVPGTAYIGAIDVSGGSSDSMALAIAHAGSDGSTVLVALRERRPPFSPEVVAAEFAEVCRAYGVARIVGDRYGGQWPVEAFARHGISYEAADRPKSAIYRDLLPLLNSGKVELLDNPRLIAQLCSLERRTARGGRDSIDHPPGAHDDVANAGAIALVLAGSEAPPALWRRDALLIRNLPVPLPIRAGAVYATAAIDERGVAVCYWAEAKRHGPAPVVLLDYEARSFSPDLFPTVAARLGELASECGGEWSGPGSLGTMVLGLFADTPLAQQALLFGLVASPIDERMWSDRAALVTAAATLIGGGKVKIAALADEKSRRLPLPLADIRPDALVCAATDAALIGLAVALPSALRVWEQRAPWLAPRRAR